MTTLCYKLVLIKSNCYYRKVFTARENCERLLAQHQNLLGQSHHSYKASWSIHSSSPCSASNAEYVAAHNTYVDQVHNINGMQEQLYLEEIPSMLQVRRKNTYTMYLESELICF